MQVFDFVGKHIVFMTDYVTRAIDVDLADVITWETNMDMEVIATEIIAGTSGVGQFDVYVLLFGVHLASAGDTTYLWKYQRLINAVRILNPNCRVAISSLLPYPGSACHVCHCSRKIGL